MAFQKVELTKEEEEALSGGGNFYKFTEVGQKLLGKLVKHAPQTGTFAKKGCDDYTFRVPKRDESGAPIPGQTEEVTVSATKKLDAQMKKIPGLAPGFGVKITLRALVDIGMPNKMPEYDVEFDPSPGSGKAAAPPPPPPKPPVSGNADDLDF